MLKMEKEYLKEYGDVPFEYRDRIDKLLEEANLSHYKINVYDEVHRIFHTEWRTLKYTIYLLPKATPRPRQGKGIFYVKGASDNRKFFNKYFEKQEDIPLISTPTKFDCKAYLPIPKTMHPVEKILAEMGFIYPISKPDWDNLAKAYCDMIQGTLLYDDCVIVDGSLHKRYSTKPRIEIELSYMLDYDSQYNRKKFERKGL